MADKQDAVISAYRKVLNAMAPLDREEQQRVVGAMFTLFGPPVSPGTVGAGFATPRK